MGEQEQVHLVWVVTSTLLPPVTTVHWAHKRGFTPNSAKPRKLDLGLAVCRQGRLYNGYTSNSISPSFLAHNVLLHALYAVKYLGTALCSNTQKKTGDTCTSWLVYMHTAIIGHNHPHNPLDIEVHLSVYLFLYTKEGCNFLQTLVSTLVIITAFTMCQN